MANKQPKKLVPIVVKDVQAEPKGKQMPLARKKESDTDSFGDPQ